MDWMEGGGEQGSTEIIYVLMAGRS